MRRVTFLVERRCPACRAAFRVRVDAAGAAAQPGAPPLPFCSERCRMLDLGLWLDESYRISEPLDSREAAQE